MANRRVKLVRSGDEQTTWRGAGDEYRVLATGEVRPPTLARATHSSQLVSGQHSFFSRINWVSSSPAAL